MTLPAFDPLPVSDLSQRQREFIAQRYGFRHLPPSSEISWDGSCLTVEHFDLAAFIDQNPDFAIRLDPILIAEGMLRFPTPTRPPI